MSWIRGGLVGLSLIATAAQAQQVAAHVRTGVWRTISVPLADNSAEPVPELRVAPGSATLLQLPVPIVGRDGFKLVGGEGRVDAQQVNSTTIVLVASREVGPERIPLGVVTADGRRYPFLLATRPDVVDIQVRVAFSGEAKPEGQGDAIVDAMLKRGKIFSRQYERPVAQLPKGQAEVDWETPFVESAVRMGGRYFIQVYNSAVVPWKVEQAKLEGASGELLKVQGIRWEMAKDSSSGLNGNVNVIIADVPKGAGVDYALKAIELVGHDARVANLGQKVILP